MLVLKSVDISNNETGVFVPTPNLELLLSQNKLELAPKAPSLLNCICPVVPAGFPPVAALNLGTHLPDTAS